MERERENGDRRAWDPPSLLSPSPFSLSLSFLPLPPPLLVGGKPSKSPMVRPCHGHRGRPAWGDGRHRSTHDTSTLGHSADGTA